MKRLFILIYILICNSESFASLTPCSLFSDIKIQSTYTLPDGSHRDIRGKGVYVGIIENAKQDLKKLSRHFIVTVAHVSKGNNLQVYTNGESVEILGRISSSKGDVEIIEISKPTNTPYMAIWDGNVILNSFDESRTDVCSNFNGAKVKPFYIGNDRLDVFGKNLALTPVAMAPFIALSPEDKFVKAKDFFFRKRGAQTRTLFRNAIGQIVFESSIIPGMSGSPIFIHLGNGFGGIPIQAFAGSVSQYSRKDFYSYSTDPNLIRFLFKEYLRGKRGEQLEKSRYGKIYAEWKHDGFNTFRVIKDKQNTMISIEAVIESGLAGGGTNGDGGGGTNGDGGGGTNGDGGSGSSQNAHYKEGSFFFGNQIRSFIVSEKSKNTNIRILANWTGVNLILSLGNKFLVTPSNEISGAMDLSQKEVTIEQSENQDFLWKRLLVLFNLG